ncbi:hypothetical protein A9P82_00420 [Arachidicoccus ginsenosidimutans]|uniref:hypothetical protein n=1 Tax=Arachidicoccus sp. BS20 TaxID=1850526 RepID=UPI0007F141F9|nr:hypothetical protein [Arachidicoccus sp. BS20]ANI87916.1 hypothetical protein A9P82_00420 [Arachidicoccus sp. BS20]
MNLPNVIIALIKAQSDYDSAAYANCFAETAIVFDEGKTHNGRTEIQNWIAGANKKYKTIMKPLEYRATESGGILSAEISGSFNGSPVLLAYHFEFKNEEIQSLRITDN